MTLTGGNIPLLIFAVVAFAGIVIGYYTRKGSGIDLHPYGKIYSGAPGAGGRPDVSGRDQRRDDYWIRRRGCR